MAILEAVTSAREKRAPYGRAEGARVNSEATRTICIMNAEGARVNSEATRTICILNEGERKEKGERVVGRSIGPAYKQRERYASW
jgi:hypothetical protein